jgi:hypothetical protein
MTQNPPADAEIRRRILDRLQREAYLATTGFGPTLMERLRPREVDAQRAAVKAAEERAAAAAAEAAAREAPYADDEGEDDGGYAGIDDDDVADAFDGRNVVDAFRAGDDDAIAPAAAAAAAESSSSSDDELSEFSESSIDTEDEFSAAGARPVKAATAAASSDGTSKPPRKKPKALPPREAYKQRAKGRALPVNTPAGLLEIVKAGETASNAGANTHLLYRGPRERTYHGLQKDTATGVRVALRRYRPRGSAGGTDHIIFDRSSAKKAYPRLRNVHTEMHLLYSLTGGDASKIPNILNGYTIVVDKHTCADCIGFMRLAAPRELRDGSAGIDSNDGRGRFDNWTNPFDRSVRNVVEKKPRGKAADAKKSGDGKKAPSRKLATTRRPSGGSAAAGKPKKRKRKRDSDDDDSG